MKPSSVQLFRVIRRTIVRKKLANDNPLRREHMCTNLDIFRYFNPDAPQIGRQWNNRDRYEGDQRWIFAISDNLNMLLKADLVIPATIMIGEVECPRYQMGDDWCLTTEGVELISLLKQDDAIDDAVSRRVRNIAMEDQELM